MKNEDTLIISKTDFEKISAISNFANTELADLLQDELARAKLVDDSQLPSDVVRMNSIVVFEDLESGKSSTVTLVYPMDADIQSYKISILSPVGSALIGLRVGQIISWPFPNGKTKSLKVTEVKS